MMYTLKTVDLMYNSWSYELLNAEGKNLFKLKSI